MIKPIPKNQDGKLLSSVKEEGNTLVFCKLKNKNCGAFLSSGKLIRVFTSCEGLPLNTIALAKISEIKEDIGSVFLLLKDKQKCHIPYSEFKNGPVKCGQNVLVRIKKEPSKGKLASATLKLGDKEDEFKEIAALRTDFSVLKEGEDYITRAFDYAISYCNSKGKHLRILSEEEFVDQKITSLIGEISEDSANKGITHDIYHDSLVSLPVLFSLTGKVDEALSKHVWLKSGAEIIIEPTESMTVIDVNSAKSSHKSASEDTFYAINTEAAEEILHQITLRNLSGILMIDFINMKASENREKFINFFRETAAKTDPDLKVFGLTKLDIMECSRTKTGKTLK